jgi:hypothetical protein
MKTTWHLCAAAAALGLAFGLARVADASPQNGNILSKSGPAAAKTVSPGPCRYAVGGDGGTIIGPKARGGKVTVQPDPCRAVRGRTR